jgi:transposase
VYSERFDMERFTRTEAKEVLTVDDYGAIRRAHRDGKSIRQIAREFGLSRRTVRHVLKHSEPRPGPWTRSRPAPVLGPFQTIIDQILADDEDAPVKQRHTAMQVFRRLQHEHGYHGCYGQVQRHVHQRRRRHRETFIPLGHLPGRRLEADFGHIYVDFPDGRRQIPFLTATWAYSNYPFVLALPFERTEAILAGMVAAFEFFGRVPGEVWWDNPRTVATLIFQGRKRQLHPRYAALASHYAFNPLFCMPARGNEKPDAESTVKGVQRRFATPVPRVANLDELNSHFRRCCEAELRRTVHSSFGPFEIGARFAEEQVVAAPLPLHRFDACVIRPAASVDKYQTAAFDRNRYSVPRPFAYQMVTVKGYVDQVVMVSGGEVIATHARSMEKGTMVVDPLHYLATLGRKPGALDHSPVYRDWKLPACFPALRAELEQHHGAQPGARRYVRVLQLLGEHPLERVRQAVEDCRRAQVISAEAIIQRTRTLAACQSQARGSSALDVASITVSQVHVPLPDLSLFNQLMSDPVSRDDCHDEAFSLRADDASPECQSTVILA